jgi:hypothetical protein
VKTGGVFFSSCVDAARCRCIPLLGVKPAARRIVPLGLMGSY